MQLPLQQLLLPNSGLFHLPNEDLFHSWYLNTSVDLPHQKRVNGITFQPTHPPEQLAPLCVSCGEDGKFKIWEEEDATDIYGKASHLSV